MFQFSPALGGDWTGTSIDTGYSRVKPYSSDIAAAMEVVEKMRERFFPRLWAAQLWNVEFDLIETETFAANYSAESLPEAICQASLAALKAIEKR
jgi:hypothetical protein